MLTSGQGDQAGRQNHCHSTVHPIQQHHHNCHGDLQSPRHSTHHSTQEHLSLHNRRTCHRYGWCKITQFAHTNIFTHDGAHIQDKNNYRVEHNLLVFTAVGAGSGMIPTFIKQFAQCLQDRPQLFHLLNENDRAADLMSMATTCDINNKTRTWHPPITEVWRIAVTNHKHTIFLNQLCLYQLLGQQAPGRALHRGNIRHHRTWILPCPPQPLQDNRQLIILHNHCQHGCHCERIALHAP